MVVAVVVVVFSMRASHKSVVVGFTQVFDTLLSRFACFWCQSSQVRPQVGTVVTAELETKDVVKDLGVELPVHILRMQTFWKILFQDTPAHVNALRSSDQASLSPPL